MKTQRDNLVLIVAFALALALHAALLPWVGAAVSLGPPRFEIDLFVELLEVPGYAQAGSEVALEVVVGEVYKPHPDRPSEFASSDIAVLSRDGVLSDDDQTVYMNSRVVTGLEGPWHDSYSSRLTLPEGADGPYSLLFRVDAFDGLPDPDLFNNTRVAPIYIDGPQRPELAVEVFNAPNIATPGGAVLVGFTIQNLGEGWASSSPQLGEHGWADRVYLSTNDRLDPTDVPLRTFQRTASLGPEDAYRHEAVELAIPRGVSGPMYLILAADADQVLDQPSFTRGFAARPIDVIDTNRPDLIVAAIGKPDRLVLGRPSPVTFSVANLGSVPTTNGDWADGLYLSRTPGLDDAAIALTRADAGRPLPPRSRYETRVEVTLPESIEPGSWYLIAKADAGDTVDEAVFEGNNTLAVPIEVLTKEQADAAIQLGDPDRPERLVVQWIEHQRLEQHIAMRSRTVQPALQSQAEPDPNAPLVDTPSPPALAATDSATGNPNKPAQPIDPNQQDTGQRPPDATATDVAPRPQTQGSPTQSRIDGLPGDDGTLTPQREGADQPNTPDATIDPTPGTDTTATPAPGERDLPSPADPDAPETDRTTDSDTPAEIESDTDSKNREETDSDTETEEQTTDAPATPKPDEQDTDKPDGDDGDPAKPSEEQTPTRAPKDESEAPPTDIKITELELQEGQVLVGKGIKVTTKLPTPPGTGSRVLSIPRNARVSVTFDSKGKVYEAKVIRTTTYKEWDAAIEASLYRWSAKGEAIDNAKPHITIEWDYLLNDLFDEDE